MQTFVIPVAARSAGTVILGPGDRVDIVNLHGGQVVDTWALPLDHEGEYLSMEHSRIHHYRLMFQPGDVLYTNRLRPILTLVEDRSPGFHDTLCPACCAESYRLYYNVVGHHDNCSDNFHAALKDKGRTMAAVPTPWNLFMHTVVENDRDLKDYPSEAAAGDLVSLRAEMECLFVVSACPQDIVVINGADGTPRDIELHVTRAAGHSAS